MNLWHWQHGVGRGMDHGLWIMGMTAETSRYTEVSGEAACLGSKQFLEMSATKPSFLSFKIKLLC